MFKVILLSSGCFSNQPRIARGSANLVALVVGERITIGVDFPNLAQL